MYVRVESVTNVVILCKRVEEDKIFQLLASLGPKYKNIRSHILMSSKLLLLSSIVCLIYNSKRRNEEESYDSKK